MGRSLRFNKNSQNITSSTEEGVKSKSPKCTSESTYSFTDNEKAQATACLALGKKKKNTQKAQRLTLLCKRHHRVHTAGEEHNGLLRRKLDGMKSNGAIK